MMDGQTTTTTVLVRGSSDRPATWALGSLFERLASGDETGGAFGLSLVTQPAGTATPLHIHTGEAEAFYLLDGTMTYRAGEQTYQLSPGSFIYLPTGIPHAFRVTGTSPVRFLGIVTPGGLMDLYDEAGRPADERVLPEPDAEQLQADIGRWLEAAPRYGIQVVGPPIPA
jgi:quercetin dioxygenase-like cupin family protein